MKTRKQTAQLKNWMYPAINIFLLPCDQLCLRGLPPCIPSMLPTAPSCSAALQAGHLELLILCTRRLAPIHACSKSLCIGLKVWTSLSHQQSAFSLALTSQLASPAGPVAWLQTLRPGWGQPQHCYHVQAQVKEGHLVFWEGQHGMQGQRQQGRQRHGEGKGEQPPHCETGERGTHMHRGQGRALREGRLSIQTQAKSQ